MLGFLAGKTAMTAVLCGLSSCFGRIVLDDNGLVGSVDIYFTAQMVVLMIAVFLAARWIYCEVRYKGACRPGKSCCARSARGGIRRDRDRCGENQGGENPGEESRYGENQNRENPGGENQGGENTGGIDRSGLAALFVSGVACGATPCSPLFVVLSRSAAASLFEAVVSGIVFSVTGFLSPVIIWLVISRVLAKQMYREISQWIKWFQFGCYVLLAGTALYTILLYKS